MQAQRCAASIARPDISSVQHRAWASIRKEDTMTTATAAATDARPGYRPVPLAPDDARFVSLAEELGREFAVRAAQHDRANTFVAANFERLREAGYLRLAVPEDLGGLGATMRQVCYAQAELAKHCASTALAVNMHLYLLLANAFRRRNGVAAAETMLRRVASEGIVLMTSGGSDGIRPTATAISDNGGYLVSGRKIFCSQAPVGDVLVTMAVLDEPGAEQTVLLMGIPATSSGFEIVETWDAHGMRGTGSHDIHLDRVKVSEAQVIARRPWGKVDGPLRSAGIHFAPPAAAVYFGVAAAARDEALRIIATRRAGDGQPLATDPTTQRIVGLMDERLRVAWWALAGALAELGEEYSADERSLAAVMMAKREVVTAAAEVVDLAMEAVGGASYFRSSPIEQACRDVRAGLFHPLNPERTLLFAGRLALGQPADTLW
jgi:alkylation response protein AidB-like acyl-CoA dehydrogenase